MLLDIMMPGMDGFAVMTDLLVRPELREPKVVILSAYEPFDQIEELSRPRPQITACMRKPVWAIEDLGRILQEIATVVRAAAGGTTAGCIPGSRTSLPGSPGRGGHARRSRRASPRWPA